MRDYETVQRVIYDTHFAKIVYENSPIAGSDSIYACEDGT